MIYVVQFPYHRRLKSKYFCKLWNVCVLGFDFLVREGVNMFVSEYVCFSLQHSAIIEWPEFANQNIYVRHEGILCDHE